MVKRRSGKGKGVSSRDAWLIGAGVGLVAIAAFLIAGGGEYFAFTTGDDIFEPEYPAALSDRVYEPVWGTVDCYHTGRKTAPMQLTGVYECDIPGWGSAACATFNCTYIGGCRFRSIGYGGDCPRWWYHILSVDEQTEYTLPLDIDYGEVIHIQAGCIGFWGNKYPPESLDTDIVGYEAKLRVDSQGYSKAGWVDGSGNCLLVSLDSKMLKKMQDESDDPLEGVEQIGMGETKDVIAGWRDTPAFGTLNPCGKYVGQDVLCKPYDALYKAKRIYTDGGHNYWTASEIITTRAEDASLCCCGGDCAADYVCEDYHCVPEGVICQYGECPWGIHQCEHLGGCIEDVATGKFYLRGVTCDEDKCCQYTEGEVMCCPSYCDRMSTPAMTLQCVYDEGCVEVEFLKECPSGYCCLPGGEWKVQVCTGGLQCCMELDDEYRGVCKKECDGIPIEDVCYTDCVADADCGLGITIPGMMCRAKCYVGCWFTDHIWYFVGGTVALVLLLVWKVFAKVSPHVRMAKAAYGAVKGAKRR